MFDKVLISYGESTRFVQCLNYAIGSAICGYLLGNDVVGMPSLNLVNKFDTSIYVESFIGSWIYLVLYKTRKLCLLSGHAERWPFSILV